jgi:hypothetical protein
MLPNELSLNDRRLFWRNYDKWCAMFTQPLVDAQLMGLSVTSIVDEYKVPLRDAYGKPRQGREPGFQPHRKMGTHHTHYTFHNEQGWEKTEYVPCDTYMVPAQYQSTKHDGMIAAMMHALYPWLAKYKCSFYSMNFYDNHAEEFYVRTANEHGPQGGHRSLYVPYDAFKAHDVAAIEKRNADYLRWYTKGEATWNSMREDANVIAFLLEV